MAITSTLLLGLSGSPANGGCRNALRLAHSWNVLPHLLRAIERQRKCAADVLLDSSKAEQVVQSCAELAAAIAACKEVPDA